MPEPSTKKREGAPLLISAAISAAIGLPLTPILYVLSIGPAIWLFNHGYVSGMIPILWSFYAPLREMRRISIFATFIDWYISLWG
jgi:hypothetical protein